MTGSASFLVALVLVVNWHRRRSVTHVSLSDAFVVRARTTRLEGPPQWHHQLSRWWLCRNARSYVHGEWRRDFAISRVKLDGLASAPRKIVRVSHDFEVDLARPPRLLSNLRLQFQLMVVTASALLSALAMGRQGQNTPPHEAYVPGGPAGVGITPEIRGRLFLANLATPAPHPFRTSTAFSTTGTTYPSTSANGGGHANSFTAHGNVATHTNAVTSHTNTDTRPLPGPF